MKKLFSTLTLAACLGVFVSCTDNEQEMDMFKPANTNSEIEVINGGTRLYEKFENIIIDVIGFVNFYGVGSGTWCYWRCFAW